MREIKCYPFRDNYDGIKTEIEIYHENERLSDFTACHCQTLSAEVRDDA